MKTVKISELMDTLAELHEACSDCDVIVAVGATLELPIAEVLIEPAAADGSKPRRILLRVSEPASGTSAAK